MPKFDGQLITVLGGGGFESPRDAGVRVARLKLEGASDLREQDDGLWLGDLRIGALGAGGLAACPDWRATGLGRETLLASPAIWQGQRLIAAPLAGKGAEWQATLSPSFGMFILSH